MNSLAFASVGELRKKVADKEITPSELISFFQARFAQYDAELGTALELFDADSIAQKSEAHGSLAGIVGLIKDNICQEGRIASCGSKMLQNYYATYDATAVARLKSYGAPLIGRANMDEFAMGSSTETSAYQLTKNPWDIQRVPGGSSGGSAAAVAAGLVPWSLGSETGGSVRQPAALCGIVGFKPTYGLISRYGLVSYASSLDQIGICARSVEDVATICSVIAGQDMRDSSTAPIAQTDYASDLSDRLPLGLTIGVIDNALNAEGIASEVKLVLEDAIGEYAKLGARIKRLTIPSMDYAAAVYFILSRAEAASNLARFDGVRYGMRAPDAKTLTDLYTRSRHDGFGDEVKARILVGNYALSVGHADEFYNNAITVQQLLKKEFDDVFKEVDFLIAPVHPTEAFEFNAFGDNSLQMDLQDYFTCAMNITGIPAISLPGGLSANKLPIGFQLIGPKFSEKALFACAHAYQQTTQWHMQHPNRFI